MIAQQKLLETRKKKSTRKKPIVREKFPSKKAVYSKPVILKINFILAIALTVVVFLSMISYLGVISKENKIKNFHALTHKLNYENIELQNKVDYLKSFYAIDGKVQKIDFLKKADKVMEVKKRTSIPVMFKKNDFFDVTSVSGY